MTIRHPRYVLFLGVGALAYPLLRQALDFTEGVVSAFDIAVLAFVASCVPLWRHGGPATIRAEAERDDGGAMLLLFLTALISGVILVAITQLALDKNALGFADIALLVGTLAASWIFANLIYAMHYARMFYAPGVGADRRGGGLDFPGDEEPGFPDFVHFAAVIGMTCQTADIAMTASEFRRIATFHGLFAFVFNLGILALTVNVLAS